MKTNIIDKMKELAKNQEHDFVNIGSYINENGLKVSRYICSNCMTDVDCYNDESINDSLLRINKMNFCNKKAMQRVNIIAGVLND